MNMAIDSTNVTLNESMAQVANMSNQIDRIDNVLYLYGTVVLIFFCVISIAINIKILISVFWIKRPISPTLYISLSLAGADAFSSSALGVGLIMNSFIPYGLEIELKGVDCFLLVLEVVRLGGVIITVFHLMALAVNHYLGIRRPLHYPSILTYKNTTILLILLWVLPIFFFAVYFNLVEGEGFQSKECKENAFLIHEKFRILFSSLFFVPFGLMVCIYIHIFCIVKKHQAKRLRFRRAGFTIPKKTAKAMRKSAKELARNVKAVHTTLYILGSFVIGWMPAIIVYMLFCNDCMFHFNEISKHIAFFVYAVLNGLIILKTLINPIIYAARMQEIKDATKRMHNASCEWITLNHFTTNREINRIRRGGISEESKQSQSKTGTTGFELFHNISVRKTRNGSTYTYNTGNNAQEYDNTLV